MELLLLEDLPNGWHNMRKSAVCVYMYRGLAAHLSGGEVPTPSRREIELER